MMTKLLLIGASGQLGQCLKAWLAQHPVTVYAPLSHELNLADRVSIRRVLNYFQPDRIINAAAYNAVDAAQSNVGKAFAMNADGPAWLARYGRQLGARLIHVSTDYVFSGQSGWQRVAQPRQNNRPQIGTASEAVVDILQPYTEADSPQPLNVYGASKRAGELAVLNEDPSALLVRTSWLYSEFGTNFVDAVLQRALTEQPLHVVSDQTSTPTCAHDLAKALGVMMLAGQHEAAATAETTRKLPGGIYHFAGEAVLSRYEWARQILLCADRLLATHHAHRLEAITATDFAAAAPRPQYSALDSERLRHYLQVNGVVFPTFAESLQLSVQRLLASRGLL